MYQVTKTVDFTQPEIHSQSNTKILKLDLPWHFNQFGDEANEYKAASSQSAKPYTSWSRILTVEGLPITKPTILRIDTNQNTQRIITGHVYIKVRF